MEGGGSSAGLLRALHLTPPPVRPPLPTHATARCTDARELPLSIGLTAYLVSVPARKVYSDKFIKQQQQQEAGAAAGGRA